MTVAGLEQDEGSVVARGTAPGGGAIGVRCAYAVGADGAHSAVRKPLGLPFEGAKCA